MWLKENRLETLTPRAKKVVHDDSWEFQPVDAKSDPFWVCESQHFQEQLKLGKLG